jgi:choline-sulfatase
MVTRSSPPEGAPSRGGSARQGSLPPPPPPPAPHSGAALRSAPKAGLTPDPPKAGASAEGKGPPEVWTVPIGEACVLALVVAVFAAVPTALRTSRAGGGFPDGLLVGAAVLLPLVALTLALMRAAGRGFRGIARAEAPPRVIAFGLALWIGLALPALAGLGAVLKATTNHRGLGGATFGVLGLVVVVLTAVIARRIVSFGQSLVARGVKPGIVAAAGAAIVVLPLMLVAAPLARGSGSDGDAGVRAAILDGAIALVATALLASMDLPASMRRLAGTWGVPVGAVVMLVAAARVEWSPGLGRAVRSGGGLAAMLLGGLEGWTDRDRDGVGAHFGGTDCDEGDPARHPGAPDAPGDGVDQDCDGGDDVRAAGSAPALVATAQAAPSAPAPAASPSAPTVAASTTAPSAKGAPPARPDIFLVTLDTVRADRTSAYGHSEETTPRLAELARRGVLFEHAYATGSDTQRALMPLVSGRRYAQTARDRREWPTILSEVDTLAERFKRSGYVTGAVTSFTWLSDERGFAQGFDRFEVAYTDAHPERGVTGPAAVKHARAILQHFEHHAQPLFLWVHLFDAHERYLEHAGIKFGRGKSGAYDGEIAFVDRQLGALIDAVAASPRAARAAWIVHGSNGEAFSEHGFVGHGGELYEEVIRVPLVIALPGGVPGGAAEGKGARYDIDAVSTLDIAPTALALAGAPAEGVVGMSLVPILSGDLGRRHGPVYIRSTKRAVVIDWPLKLMKVERARADRLLLFDLGADRGETRDLTATRGEDLQRLGQLLEKLEADARAP